MRPTQASGNSWRVWFLSATGIVLFLIGALAAACGTAAPQPTPTPTKTPRPSGSSPTPKALDLAALLIATPSPEIVATEIPTSTPTQEPSPVPTGTLEPVLAVVKTDNVALRRGPGQEYPVVTQVGYGETLAVIASNPTRAWWQVRYRESALWVSSESVKVSGPTQNLLIVEVRSSTPTPASQPTFTPAPTFPPVGDAFGYGIRVRVNTPNDLAFVVDKTKDLKFEWLQLDVKWQDVEKNPGQRDWASLDNTINVLSQNGFKLLATVKSAPEWSRDASADQTVSGPPATADSLAAFLTEFAGRYRGKIQAIEIWSGQNLWFNWGREPLSPTRYADLLCRSYQAIKAVDPGIVVVSGGLEPTRINDPLIAVDDLIYLERMYQGGAKNCFDAVGAHPKGYNNPPNAKLGYTDPAAPSFKNNASFFFRETLEGYRSIMLAHGANNKRIWPTEFGWAADANPTAELAYARDNTRQEQADYIAEAFRLGKGWGWIGPMFVSVLTAGSADADADLKSFNLWLQDGPTLAYERLKTLQAK